VPRIVTALAVLGGPLGMLGGIAALGIMGLVADAVAEYGLSIIFAAVVAGLVKEGHSRADIRRKINGYPITDGLKKKILGDL
jgi:hypothetical protein